MKYFVRGLFVPNKQNPNKQNIIKPMCVIKLLDDIRRDERKNAINLFKI